MNLFTSGSHRMTASYPMTKKFIFSKVNVFVYIRLIMNCIKLCHLYLNKSLLL